MKNIFANKNLVKKQFQSKENEEFYLRTFQYTEFLKV